MALVAMLPTPYGETRESYVRINSLSISNHGVSPYVLFRGYLSREAFLSGSAYCWERELEMILDVAKPIWTQAYAELLLTLEFAEAVEA